MRLSFPKSPAMALVVLAIAGCGGGKADNAAPATFSQAAFNNTVMTYLNAEATHFNGVSTDPPLSGSIACALDGAGTDNAKMLCNLGEFATLSEAKAAYASARDHLIKALPNAQGGEQQNVSPDIPVRLAAGLNKNDVVLLISQDADSKKWAVGYVFTRLTN